MKQATTLSAKAVAAIKGDGFHAVGGVIGLCLRIRGDSRRYVLRYISPETGRRTSMTIGDASVVSLAEARKLGAEAKIKLTQGIDPGQEKRNNIEKARSTPKAVTFAYAAEKWREAVEEHAGVYTKTPRKKDFRNVLATHIIPKIGNIRLKDLKPKDVFECVKPHWTTTSGTRHSVMQAISKIWKWAVAMEYVSGDNPANYNGPLGVLLKTLGPPKTCKNRGALLPEEVPEFVMELYHLNRLSAKALLFAILTANRLTPVTMAKWEDIDLQKKVWYVPEEDMKVKGRGRFKVYLSDQAISIIQSIPKNGKNVFSSRYGGATRTSIVNNIRDINNQRLEIGLPRWIDIRQQELYGEEIVITPHGVARASFKTWTRTKENLKKFHQDAVELCLAHDIDDKYDGAYDRADLEEERRRVMAAWGEYCFSRIQQA